jgi:hypothetical protein
MDIPPRLNLFRDGLAPGTLPLKKMNLTTSILLGSILLASGCQSTLENDVGITEKKWLRKMIVADLVYAKDGVKAYRSGTSYFYFLNDKLVRIDSNRLPPQAIKGLPAGAPN